MNVERVGQICVVILRKEEEDYDCSELKMMQLLSGGGF